MNKSAFCSIVAFLLCLAVIIGLDSGNQNESALKATFSVPAQEIQGDGSVKVTYELTSPETVRFTFQSIGSHSTGPRVDYPARVPSYARVIWNGISYLSKTASPQRVFVELPASAISQTKNENQLVYESFNAEGELLTCGKF